MAHGCTVIPLKSRTYVPRNPKSGLIYQTFENYFPALQKETEESDRPMPAYVEKEVAAYIKCGILEHGFIQLKCQSCDATQFIPFSCKKRGFCPSCIGKRMNEGAAFFVDNVIPQVPIRQWVLSYPMPMRFWMAKNPELLSKLLAIFMRAVHRYYKNSVRQSLGPGFKKAKLQSGSLTVIQRFGSALNLNPHKHVLFLDGCYIEEEDGQLRFIEAPVPKTDEVVKLLELTHRRMIRELQKRGLVPKTEIEAPEYSEEEASLISEVQGSSIQYRIATGPNRGEKIRKVGSLGNPGDDAFEVGPLAAILGGFSLHASVYIPKNNRTRLEQLCRYLLRPPVAENRLSRMQNGDLRFEMKAAWKDGTRAILFTPKEFIEKLIAIVPQPRGHQVRFHGILAPSATDRPKVVPKVEAPSGQSQDPGTYRPKRLSWADLLRRTFQIDLTICGLCGGKVKFHKAVMKADEIRSILARVKPDPD